MCVYSVPVQNGKFAHHWRQEVDTEIQYRALNWKVPPAVLRCTHRSAETTFLDNRTRNFPRLLQEDPAWYEAGLHPCSTPRSLFRRTTWLAIAWPSAWFCVTVVFTWFSIINFPGIPKVQRRCCNAFRGVLPYHTHLFTDTWDRVSWGSNH